MVFSAPRQGQQKDLKRLLGTFCCAANNYIVAGFAGRDAPAEFFRGHFCLKALR
jgi:hypothetical protein